jgi:asparagine synthase (glutamine-hydrolysing)
VFRLAREHGVTVLLDGQGADEMLAGYEQFFRLYLRDPGADRGDATAIRTRYPLALAGGRERLSRALPYALRRTAARFAGRGSDVLFGMQSDVARQISPAATDDTLAAALERETFREHLPVLLRYGDRNSMAHSREVRLPFCDHRLASFALGLPASRHMGGAQTKRLLREAMRGILPEEVRTRWNKQGFVPPQDIWFAGPLAGLAEDTLNDPAFGTEGLWDRGWWHGALARFRAGDHALAATLWRPVMEQSWRRHFVVRAAAMEKYPVFA